MKKKSANVKRLEDYLKKARGNRIQLAAHMGFASPDTISSWIRVNRIPPFHEEKVTKYLDAQEVS